MRHSGGCHCGSWNFETNHDPMFLYQCNCESCRKLSGSYSLGACYKEDELVCSGPEVDYDYQGGSGELMKTRFCPTCHVRLTVRPQVLPELVFVPLGNFVNANQFQKIDLEIWTGTKLDIVHDQTRAGLSVSDSGTAERITKFLETLR